MERKEKFIEGERYHVFTRGVEKRITFEDANDYERFLLLLLIANSREKVHFTNKFPERQQQGEPLMNLMEMLPDHEQDRIVHVEAYALMPNHVHLLVSEIQQGGISKFMLKLLTAYSMYFNIKYERSGPLFTRPFRSKHIDTDEYFRWVFSYINLNPLSLFQHNWKEAGLQEVERAGQFMRTYRYSSFPDYFVQNRRESRILNKVEQLSTNNPASFDELVASILAAPHYQHHQHQGEPLM